jgi:hypothetical protein
MQKIALSASDQTHIQYYEREILFSLDQGPQKKHLAVRIYQG